MRVIIPTHCNLERYTALIGCKMSNVCLAELQVFFDKLPMLIQEAMEMIGCVVISEIFDVLKNKEDFNEERYITALNKLPEQPW